MCSWGKLWTRRYKKTKKNPNCHFWRARSKDRVLGAKGGYCTCPLHSTPPNGWVDHLRHPSGRTPGHTPSLTLYKEPDYPSSGSEQGNLLLVFVLPCCSRGPNKALLDWGRPRTLVGINVTLTYFPTSPQIWRIIIIDNCILFTLTTDY